MIVCIAEKPSVARDIADVLGARDKKDGYIEGNGYQVTWTFGHLCTLKEPHEYTPNWKSWSLGSLPMIPPRFGIKLISNPTYERQFHTIENLMQHADMIINCGDAGQEGELIQRWVMQKAGARCPVKRLWISSLTEEAIREGFAKLRDASDFQPLYEAGLSRAIGDWLLGMNATRLYTMKYGQNRQVLSIGRVQTPTLALIVNRQLEIQNFVPKQYWELKTVYRDTAFSAIIRKSEEELVLEAEKQKEAIAAGKKPKSEEENRGIDPITDCERGLALLEQIKNSPFTITDVTKKNGREAPLRLFDLTSLQVECNRKFAYSADETLKLIQSLYEKKVATYPRVDTTFLSDDIYPKCPGILKGLRDYEVFTAPLVGTTLTKSKKVFDNSKVTDHHAIIPTGQHPQNLTDMERRVFDLIARRFIAVFYPDCLFATTTVMGEVEEIEFKTTGKQILSPGWRVVFGTTSAQSQEEKDEKSGEEEKVLPTFVKGESGSHTPGLLEKWTQPPRPYTEATLLRAMETAGKLVDNDELRDALKENGIGRPSTRAAIIETLFKRNYIRKEKKNLIATPTGVELILVIHEELLKSAELTGIWEKKLREIEKCTYNAGQFLEELKQMVSEVVMSVLSDNSNRHITIQMPAVGKSGKVTDKAGVTDKPKKEPKKRTPRKQTAGKKTAQDADVAVSSAEGGMASTQPDGLVGQACPVCGKGTIIKGRTAYGCSEWKNGCTFRKPFE
ncbi:DNA topoisomerase 3 [Bacteroides helcogenes]|uniref:DNA topoisomerase n=1 Tax=Bacteroides helcogenes (strain ATCC 35417 / DSM 20613 / JCM 6297 / CCUG 15421 / P 36-108) TaxID=693979 RepID=E6ST50_BACT6|nr:DNA topoisomerase 3 [Bacteroides helcogenes]ADV45254.1 DNA topoisomerase III [Bacteroides helcogenes P 36-108]MDY5238813.1 DNA topoisomerase 3 [Bacteroides helcogenes]